MRIEIGFETTALTACECVTLTCKIDFFWVIHTLALSATKLGQENFGGSSPSSPGFS
jgi:hypothetical protein